MFVSQFGESGDIRHFLSVFTEIKSFSVVRHFIVSKVGNKKIIFSSFLLKSDFLHSLS